MVRLTQGFALGWAVAAPFGARKLMVRVTQGFALGWAVAAPFGAPEPGFDEHVEFGGKRFLRFNRPRQATKDNVLAYGQPWSPALYV